MSSAQEKPKAGEGAEKSAAEDSVVAVAVLGADLENVSEDEQAAQNEMSRPWLSRSKSQRRPTGVWRSAGSGFVKSSY